MTKAELEKKYKSLQRKHRELIKENNLLNNSTKKPSKQDEVIESLQKANKALNNKKNKEIKRLEKVNLQLTERYRETLIAKNGAADIIEESRQKVLTISKAFKSNVHDFVALDRLSHLFMSKAAMRTALLSNIKINEESN